MNVSNIKREVGYWSISRKVDCKGNLGVLTAGGSHHAVGCWSCEEPAGGSQWEH
jgi:hypothetical protein